MKLNRRTWLQGIGGYLCLPRFESVAQSVVSPAQTTQRLVCVGNLLGFYPEAFWPTTEASSSKQQATIQQTANFQFGQSSQPLQQVRDHITVLQGLDHGVKGGHFAVHSYLSGVLRSEANMMPNGIITIDQYAADHIGSTTRFPSLVVGDSTGLHGGCQMSWTRAGTRIPPIEGVSSLYQLLYEQTNRKQRDAVAKRLAGQNSILDSINNDANQYRKRLSGSDQHKFDEYLTAVRDVEQRVSLRQKWLDEPRPEPPFRKPSNTNMVEDLPLLYDLIALALQTDSTRVVTLEIGGAFRPTHLGIQGDYHALSHHGKRQGHIDSLITLDTYQIKHFARFISKLVNMTDTEGKSFLDSTTVLLGSGMGDANRHTNKNLPLVLAGGGFQHGSMLSYAPATSSPPPLCNLYVSILQQLGIETDSFGKSTGTLRGLPS